MEYWQNLSLCNLKCEFEGVLYVEEWKDIPGYEGYYQCSSFGRFKCVRVARRNVKIRIMRQSLKKNGYIYISLAKNGRYEYFRTHRLIAKVFIDNPDLKEQVNHIDGHKSNNKASNLEWNTASENQKHSYDVLGTEPSFGMLGKKGDKHHASKKVAQMNLNGHLIKIHESMSLAADCTKVPQANIWKVCVGERLSAGGFKWGYA